MRKFFLLTLLYFTAVNVWAETGQWSPGSVIGADGKKVGGPISFPEGEDGIKVGKSPVPMPADGKVLIQAGGVLILQVSAFDCDAAKACGGNWVSCNDTLKYYIYSTDNGAGGVCRSYYKSNDR